jgi:hypothetical protein
MNDFAFFEYTAKLTSTGHSDERQGDEPGEVLRCVAKVRVRDPYGRDRNDAELSETAADLILVTINPGPGKQMGQFNVQRITEGKFVGFGVPRSTRQIGESTVFVY